MKNMFVFNNIATFFYFLTDKNNDLFNLINFNNKNPMNQFLLIKVLLLSPKD